MLRSHERQDESNENAEKACYRAENFKNSMATLAAQIYVVLQRQIRYKN
jgi:hypothetical protein